MRCYPFKKGGTTSFSHAEGGASSDENVFQLLLPVRPPSRTYLGLGVMLEPYALDVVYISGT